MNSRPSSSNSKTEPRPEPTKMGAQDCAEEWVEVNHPENLLFGFLGAWIAFMFGLWLYQGEIQGKQNSRSPASHPAVPTLIQSQLDTPQAILLDPALSSPPAEAWLPFLY